MNTLYRQRTSGYAGLTGLFLFVAAVAQGCGNDNPEPTTPVVTGGTSTGGSGGSGAKGGSGGTGNEAGSDNPGGSDATGGTGSNTGGTTSTGGTGAKGGKGGKGGTGNTTGGTGNTTGGTGNTGNEGGDGNQGGDGPVDCSPQGEGKDRCFPCKPTDGENAEFLNHCNDASCSHFDNESRIEGFTTPLPPL